MHGFINLKLHNCIKINVMRISIYFFNMQNFYMS